MPSAKPADLVIGINHNNWCTALSVEGRIGIIGPRLSNIRTRCQVKMSGNGEGGWVRGQCRDGGFETHILPPVWMNVNRLVRDAAEVLLIGYVTDSKCDFNVQHCTLKPT